MANPPPAPMGRPKDDYYLVRQRYKNALPPPHLPPKLLSIPRRGLDYYCSPSFADTLLKDQPINIEADAFLGMPIDLVGMPGIFEGDESSIQAPLVTPPVHPKDRNLLRPFKSLGQPKTEAAGISFLRRTQYTADERGRVEGGGSRNLGASIIKRKRQTDASKEEPINILRNTIKGFDIAYPEDAYKGPDTPETRRGAAPTMAEIDAWKNPKHPSKPHLKVLDSYPILPDLDAMTDANGYMVAKFAGVPTEKTDSHDERMDVGLLHPEVMDPELEKIYNAKVAAHEADPTRHPKPANPNMDYEFFIPTDEKVAKNIKKKFDLENPDRDDAKLYNHASEGKEKDSFRLHHLRFYETSKQVDASTNPYQEVAMALYDPEHEKLKAEAKGEELLELMREKAAYYYPIMTKMSFKPRRGKHLAHMGTASHIEGGDDTKIDAVDVKVRDLDAEDLARRAAYKTDLGIEMEIDGTD